MSMKPNNLIAILVAIILLAIGIALAVIHQNDNDKVIKTGFQDTPSPVIHNRPHMPVSFDPGMS